MLGQCKKASVNMEGYSGVSGRPPVIGGDVMLGQCRRASVNMEGCLGVSGSPPVIGGDEVQWLNYEPILKQDD